MTQRSDSSPDLTFTRRDVALGLLIVLLAFAFRAVIILDRAHAPLASAFAPLPAGSDQWTYYSHIAAHRAGTFPPPTYFYQPGMSWFLIAASTLLGTDDLAVLRLLVAALAAINCGLFVAVARLATGRRSVGLLAGLLLAIYPVGAFYDTDFVITSQATILLTLALLGVLWLWRRPRQWAGAALYGISFGAIAVTRFEPLVLAPVFGLWLLWQRRDRRAVAQVALAAALCLAVILPVALHNRAGGANYLITPVGQAEMYHGNNRDADGTRSSPPATQVTSQDYRHFLWLDIQLAPRRFGELVLHKIGLYGSAQEPGNNLNYVLSGEAVSPLLRAVPLDYRVLLALALFGLAIMIRRREPATSLFALSFLALMASILLIWVEARLRTPSIVFLIPPAAYGLVAAVETLAQGGARLRQGERLAVRAMLRVGLLLAGIAVLLGVLHIFETRLPRQQTVGALPASAQAVQAVYDGTLELAGWRIEEQYSRAGVIEPFRPYVVTLYWKLLKPTATDYSFALAYVVDGERVFGFDYPIGRVSYPARPTSQWAPGDLVVEHVGLAYKAYDGPIGVSGLLLLAVYPERRAEELLAAEGISGSPPHLTLAQPAILWGPGQLPADLPLISPAAAFGDVLVLQGWQAPARVSAGQPFEVRLGWQTTGVPMGQSYQISVHLLDSRGQSAAQQDAPPHEGRLLTSSLPTHFQFEDRKTLTAPAQPGRYTVAVTVYPAAGGDRLAVPGTPDNLLRLGEIQVEAPAP